MLFSRWFGAPVVIFNLRRQRHDDGLLEPRVVIGRSEPGLPVLFLQTYPMSKTLAHYCVLIPRLSLYNKEFSATLQLYDAAE